MYRDDHKRCPKCGAPVEINRRCAGCSGAWVEESRLLSMWAEMGGDPDRLQARPRGDGHGPRPCPACHQAMERLEIMVVPVDRCPRHGWWFDIHELETALAAASIETRAWLEMFAHLLTAM